MPKTGTEAGMDSEGRNDHHVMPDPRGVCRLVFEYSSLPTAMVSGAQHIISYVNSAFCVLVGQSADQLTGKTFGEIVPDEACLSSLDHVYQTGVAEDRRWADHTKANAVFWSYLMWPLMDAEAHPVGVIIRVTESTLFHLHAVAMNQELLLSSVRQHELTEKAAKLASQLQLEIAERKRMENALLVSEKLAATARLASTMSHEINNPLGAITNLVYLLAPLQTTAEGKAYVATLEDQVKGLTRIATQMLKFHRDHNQPTKFMVGELLREVVHTYRSQAERQGVEVIQRIESDGMINGFRGELIQVLSNLLLNALEATPTGGRVSAHLYAAPSWMCKAHYGCGYCLSVADTGSGIAPQHLSRIFEPFFSTKGDRGSGLGLWLCAGIISRVGGSMRVWSSRLPNRSGTCFSVFLPAEEAVFTPLRRRYERQDKDAEEIL